MPLLMLWLLVLGGVPGTGRRAWAQVGWGFNGTGSLGNGTTDDAYTPVDVTTAGTDMAGKTVVQIAAGTGNSMALCSDGTLFTWGSNYYGELGNGTTSDTPTLLPQIVPTSGTALEGKTVIQVVVGGYFDLALCSDGTVVSWGNNESGQLGNNTTANSAIPVAVTTSGTLSNKKVVQVAAGSSDSLALCSDGTVFAWGFNTYGELGNGTSNGSAVPVAVTTTGTALAGKKVVQVAVGFYHCLAVCSDGVVVGWGANEGGQLGNNTTTDKFTAVAVTTTGASNPLSSRKVVQVAGGDQHSIALCSDGTLAAWGTNGFGQLGNNRTARSLIPVAVTTSGTALAGKRAIQVAAGYRFSEALCSDGSVATWGADDNGRLGNDANSQFSLTATSVALAGKQAVQISTSNGSSLALVATAQAAVPAGTSPSFVISEYRTGTTAAPRDEYIEIYNASGAPLDLNGYQIVAGLSNPGQTLYTFIGSTIVPTRGHLLLTSPGYSLGSYASSNGTLAVDLTTGGGLALLNAAGSIVDQVGVAGYVESSAVPAAPTSGEYAYVRKVLPGGTGSPVDTDNNANDFFLVSTTSTSAVASPRLGAPGPENLASPIQSNGSLGYSTVTQVRTGAPGGTLSLRRRLVNNTTSTITSIKMRVVEITAGTGTTANTPVGSGTQATSVANTGIALGPNSIGFFPLTLEAPSVSNTGGVNATLTTGPITLLPGQSLDFDYTVVVTTGGTYRVVASFEAGF